MPVLKASRHEQPYARDAIVLDLGDLGRQAARLRSAAEAKAAQIVTDAEKRAAQLIEGAEAKGFEQGRQAGHEQGLVQGREEGGAQALAASSDELAKLQQAWSDVATQLDGHRREMDREARQAVLTFALKLSERVVHRVIEVDPTVVVDQVAGALAHVLRPLDVMVRVNPADKPLLEKALPELMAEFRHFEHLQLADDPEVSCGGCVVTCGEGEIDATLETQIRRIVDLILPAAEPDPAESDSAEAASAAGSDDGSAARPTRANPQTPGTPFAVRDPDARPG